MWESIIASLSPPSLPISLLIAVAVVVIGGGVFALVQAFKRKRFDTALAYAIGGLFASLFMLIAASGAYSFEMQLVQDDIVAASTVEEANVLREAAQRRAEGSYDIAFLTVIIAFPMAILLFIQALILRGRTKMPARESETPPKSTSIPSGPTTSSEAASSTDKASPDKS